MSASLAARFGFRRSLRTPVPRPRAGSLPTATAARQMRARARSCTRSRPAKRGREAEAEAGGAQAEWSSTATLGDSMANAATTALSPGALERLPALASMADVAASPFGGNPLRGQPSPRPRRPRARPLAIEYEAPFDRRSRGARKRRAEGQLTPATTGARQRVASGVTQGVAYRAASSTSSAKRPRATKRARTAQTKTEVEETAPDATVLPSAAAATAGTNTKPPVPGESPASGGTTGSRKRKRQPKASTVVKREPPPQWEEQLENIRCMRQARDAPVDTMGCERLFDPAAPPAVKRFQILVSLMLSSQTRDEATSACVRRLIAHGLTVDNILATPEARLVELLYGVGFYRRKAQYLLRTCRILRDEYDRDIPRTLKGLTQLPGVGIKMGTITMNVAHDDVVGIGVDVHVHRIANRLGWANCYDKGADRTQEELHAWVPRHLWGDINILLVGFGQQVCQPRNPKCELCLNKAICPASTLRGGKPVTKSARAGAGTVKQEPAGAPE